MLRTSKTEGSSPSHSPKVGGDNTGGRGGAEGGERVFMTLAHLEGGGEDRVRRQVVDILR